MQRFTPILLLAILSAIGFANTASAQRPQIIAPPVVVNDPPPWANKLFLADIKKSPNQDAPRELEFDFGTVPHGTVTSQKFVVTNIYDVPIQVIDVRRECGCLTAYPPQKVLQPNEEAEFTVTMNTGIFPNAGEIRKTLFVTFGPNFVSTAVIRFKATSRRDVTLTPGQINLGIVAQGEKKSSTAVIKYSGARRDWKITGIVPTKAPFDVELKDAARGFLTGAEYWLTVTLKADAPAGQLNETIVLKTNDPEVPTVSVSVQAQLQSIIQVAPNRVAFRSAKVGEPVVQKLLMKSAQPFSVEAMAEDADGISVKPLLNATLPLQTIEVQFTPKKVGRVTKDLKLRVRLGNGMIITVPFEADVKE